MTVEDDTEPSVSSFSVNSNTNDFTTTDTSLDVAWSVTDSGGSGIDQVEVWRQVDGGGWGASAFYIDASASGNSDSGTWTDNVTCGHTYEYGIHVRDNSGNTRTETESGLDTITATINCPVTPDFTISVTAPSSRTIDEGNEADYNIVVTSQNGFSNSVSFSTSNCPSGATCSFSPSSVNPTANSTLTISNAPVGGPYTVGVTATGGGKTHNASIYLTVESSGGGGGSDIIAPTITLFQIDNIRCSASTMTYDDMNSSGSCENTVTSADGQPDFDWTVTDTGGAGLRDVKIWRTTDDNGSPLEAGWTEVREDTINISSGDWSYTSTLTQGIYWFGIHATDNDDNCITGTGTHCGGVSSDSLDPRNIANPIKVEVPGAGGGGEVVADFNWCTSNGADTIIFRDTTTGGTTPYTTFAWDFGDGSCPAAIECDDRDPVHTYTVGSPCTWWGDCDWQYRKTVTFDNSGRGNIDNAPILIKLTSGNFDFTKAQSNGEDIRFMDSDDSTSLPYEIEDWDNVGQTAYIWVKVPRINAGSSVDYIYIYYGNDSESDAQTASQVWTSYDGVYHLDGDVVSATGNYNGTNYGTADTTGYIANARNFDSTDRIATAYSPNHGDFTYEGWYYKTLHTHGNIMKTQYYDGSDNQEIRFAFRANGNMVEVPLGSGNFVDYGRWSVWTRDNDSSSSDWLEYVPTSSLYGSWHHVAITRDQSAKDFILYVDGQIRDADLSSGADGTISFNDGLHDKLYLEWGCSVVDQGSGIFREKYFNGRLDELRFSTTYKDEDWMSFQYCSMTQSCLTYGGEKPSASSGASTFNVTLTTTDSDTNTDTSDIQVVDFEASSICQPFDITNGVPVSDDEVALVWDQQDVTRVDDYSFYYYQYDTGWPSPPPLSVPPAQVSHDCPVGSSCNAYIGGLDQNTTYAFIIHAEKVNLNNSTNPPTYVDCDGGDQVNLQADWCQVEITTQITTPGTPEVSKDGCGQLEIVWDGVTAVEDYVIKRSIIELGNMNYATVTDDYLASADLGCPGGGSCTYIDNEIVPEVIYYYKVSGRDGDEAMTPWTDASNGQWSYCYRAPTWEEK